MKLFLFLHFTILVVSSAGAAPVFPYSVRTKDYSGWTPATQSDTNTAGMAGATIALPASVSSAQNNPAGFAMETGSVSAQINRISVYDMRLQPDAINSSQWGLGVSPPPWGFAITYYSPFTENDFYASPNTGDPMSAEVSMKEFGLTVSRYFLDSRFALGVKFELMKAVRELGNNIYNSYAPSFTLGGLYRLPHHMMLGVGYTPPLEIGPNTNNTPQSELPGFNQSVLRPSELDLGFGWVPNRFFKVGTQLSRIGDTSNTALLSDQSITTGAVPTWVPRIGESYVIADYKNFKSEWAIGSYYDFSRLQGQGDRLHFTSGLEANPWFVNLGIGYDYAPDYHNFMGGVGVDFVRLAQFFKIIPLDPTPHYDGVFPQPGVVSADGFPDAMTPGEKREAAPTSLGDVGTIIKEAPGNIADKFTGDPTTVELKEKAAEDKKNEGGAKP